MTHSVEQQAQSLADYLPGGRCYHAKNIYDSNFRTLLRGMAQELSRTDGNIDAFKTDIIPDATVYFIDEWEEAVGIPDSCFSGAGTLTERRRDVLIKLASLGVQTADDFESMASLFGLAVTVRSGTSFATFPLEFPVLLFSTEKDMRFTIVVDFPVTASNQFPLTFPIVFGTDTIGVLECLFRRLKPANCDIIFRQV